MFEIAIPTIKAIIKGSLDSFKRMEIPRRQKSRTAGFTLIEATLVMAVLLVFISVLFIGAASYKEGTNRAKCLLTISTVQRAVRSYQNLQELEPGDVVGYDTLVGKDKLIEYITPCGTQEFSPITSTSTDGFDASGYIGLGRIPESGTPYLSCKTTGLLHVPAEIGGW